MDGIILNDVLYKAENCDDCIDCDDCKLKNQCDKFGDNGICGLMDKSDNVIFTSSYNLQKIILVGKGGSGKDYIRKKLEQQGYIYGISCTSRPPRKGEIEGKDYRFLSKEKFEQLIKTNDFVQYQKFGEYYYGTLRYDWKNSNLFIMNIEGLNLLSAEDRKRSIVFYVQCDENKIYERMMNRENNIDDKKIKERIKLDEEIFKDFKNYDFIINNN